MFVRNKIFLFLVSSLFILGISCRTNEVLHTYQSDTKTMFFIPMVHVGSPKYYQTISYTLDSLQKLNYRVYFENIGIKKKMNASTQDTIQRKFRKIFGFHVSEKGYLKQPVVKTVRKTKIAKHPILNKKTKLDVNESDAKLNTLPKEDKLKSIINTTERPAEKSTVIIKKMNQPSQKGLGVNKKQSVNADIPKDELISEYEKKYGKLLLDSCDFSTPLHEKYKCKRINKKKRFYIIHTFRNNHLANLITNSKDTTFVLMFGAAHEKNLFKTLKSIDDSWYKKK